MATLTRGFVFLTRPCLGVLFLLRRAVYEPISMLNSEIQNGRWKMLEPPSGWRGMSDACDRLHR